MEAIQKYSPVYKAIAGALLTCSLSWPEGLVAASALIVGFGGVFYAPANKPRDEPVSSSDFKG